MAGSSPGPVQHPACKDSRHDEAHPRLVQPRHPPDVRRWHAMTRLWLAAVTAYVTLYPHLGLAFGGGSGR